MVSFCSLFLRGRFTSTFFGGILLGDSLDGQQGITVRQQECHFWWITLQIRHVESLQHRKKEGNLPGNCKNKNAACDLSQDIILQVTHFPCPCLMLKCCDKKWPKKVSCNKPVQVKRPCSLSGF